jgi:hypothetical protein
VTGNQVCGDGRREADQGRFRREGGADNAKFMGKLHQTPRLSTGRREAEGIGGNPPPERTIGRAGMELWLGDLDSNQD